MSKTLLEQFAKKLGIETQIASHTFSSWNMKYLSKLFFAEKNFEEDSREALKLVVKAALHGDFRNIIEQKLFNQSRYSAEELELIQEIQKHNRDVKMAFEQEGVDYYLWLRYPKLAEFFVGASETEKQKRFDSFLRELSEETSHIMGSFREKKPGILPPERAKALFKTVFQKYSIAFKEGMMVLPKGAFSPLDIQKPLQEFITFLEKEQKISSDFALGTSLDHLRNILAVLLDLQKEAKQKGYSFQIKQWDREPGYDIFQGNYTHCCIAVENFNRAAILDYLTDTGMTCLEVKDQNTGETIAQTFVFLAQDQDGEVMMVMDNVEVNNDYRGLAQDIRSHLFAYVKDFADALIRNPAKKIDTVLLGTAYNDIETSDLLGRNVIIKKIGGPGPAGTQYLDSFGSAWVDPSHLTSRQFHVALDGIREKISKAPRLHKISQVEVLSRLNEEALRGILEVERASFPPQMQSSRADLRETLESQKGVQLVIRSRTGEIIGYVASIPHPDACEELQAWDPELRAESGTLYIESIAITPAARDLRTFLAVGKALLEEAKRRGYTKLAMHARIAGDLSAVLQKRYGARSLRRVENWHNFGEPFEYLELAL